MKRNDRIMLISLSMSGLFMLAGIWYWWKYTERTVWGFIGIVLIVAPLLGILIKLIVLTPFIDVDEIRKEEEAERLRQEAERETQKKDFYATLKNRI